LADSLGRVLLSLTRPFASPPLQRSGALPWFIASVHEDSPGRVWVVSGRRRTTAAPPFSGGERPVTPKPIAHSSPA